MGGYEGTYLNEGVCEFLPLLNCVLSFWTFWSDAKIILYTWFATSIVNSRLKRASKEHFAATRWWWTYVNYPMPTRCLSRGALPVGHPKVGLLDLNNSYHEVVHDTIGIVGRYRCEYYRHFYYFCCC